MIICLVISLPKIWYIHRIYVWFYWPTLSLVLQHGSTCYGWGDTQDSLHWKYAACATHGVRQYATCDTRGVNRTLHVAHVGYNDTPHVTHVGYDNTPHVAHVGYNNMPHVAHVGYNNTPHV